MCTARPCDIFGVFNYIDSFRPKPTQPPCDPEVVPRIVMSLRKNGRVQITAHAQEGAAEHWKEVMMEYLNQHRFPGETFQVVALTQISRFVYQLSVERFDTSR